jgi:hypothetical protein
MSKRFICPIAEGCDLNGAKRMILTEMFEYRESANNDKIITNDGMKYEFFDDYTAKNDARMTGFGFDISMRYLDFYNIPAELKTIAQISALTGMGITANFTDALNYIWKFRSLSELFAAPYWFTVFLEDSMILIAPERGPDSVRRGTLVKKNILKSNELKKNDIQFTGEGAEISNFPKCDVIIPELLDDALKRRFDNRTKALSDIIVFEAWDKFYAEPGDWVDYGGVYIIVSRRENEGKPVYTAVREVTDNPPYATADIPWTELLPSLSDADTVDGKHASEFIDTSSGSQSVNAAKPNVTNLDADKLDGKHANEFIDTSSGSQSVNAAKPKVTNLDADKWDGLHATIDTWHYVGASGEPAFQNGWVNSGGSEEPLRFKLKQDGSLLVSGVIKSGTAITVFTLPVGYRPATKNIYGPAFHWNGTTRGCGRAEVTPAGAFYAVDSGALGNTVVVVEINKPLND